MKSVNRFGLLSGLLSVILLSSGCADDGKKKGCDDAEVEATMADYEVCAEDCAADTACEDSCFDVLCEELDEVGCDVSETDCSL